MIVQMLKFNIVLNGRPSAKEVVLRIQQIVNGSAEKEDVVIDFDGVEILTPSFADELLHGLREKYGSDKIKIINTSQSVSETIKIVENQ
jgi:hypothetical protein